MGTLYVDRQGLSLRMHDGVIELRADGERLRSVPARLVDRVVLRADTQLGSTTLAALADAGVGVLAFGGRGGQRVAHVLGTPAADGRARIAQCQRVNDEAWASAWTGHILRSKLRAQQRLLSQALVERADLRKPLVDAIGGIQRCIERLASAGDRASQRGLEGAAAAAYFRAYVQLFAPALDFAGRRRRPPPDPVNACLSLGYTLLQGQAVQACWQAGLDPMIGFLHLPAHGRASLACDLIEPWRCHIDAWVWRQFSTRALRPEHFGRDGAGACLMGKAARGHFYAEITPVLQRQAKGVRRHARMAARALREAAVLPDDDGWGSDGGELLSADRSSQAEAEGPLSP